MIDNYPINRDTSIDLKNENLYDRKLVKRFFFN